MISTHKVNIDAIAAGASAFILNWPSEAEGPTSVPARAHQILWEDDYWRGIDVMRATFEEAVAGWRRARIHEIRDPDTHAIRIAQLDGVVRATMAVVIARRAGESVTKVANENADHDLVEVIEAALLGICKTGDPDRRDEHAWNCDLEVECDASEEA
jgi:hypothetical protein